MIERESREAHQRAIHVWVKEAQRLAAKYFADSGYTVDRFLQERREEASAED